MIIDRSQEKELGMENCAILLIEAVLERFAEHAHELVKNMVVNAWKSTFIVNNCYRQLLGHLPIHPEQHLRRPRPPPQNLQEEHPPLINHNPHRLDPRLYLPEPSLQKQDSRPHLWLV